MPLGSWFPTDEWTLEDLKIEAREGQKLMAAEAADKAEKSEEYYQTKWGSYNRSVFVGLDLGKKSDYTAIVFVAPFVPRDPDTPQYVYHVTKIYRYPLETPYPRIARALKKTNDQLVKKREVDYIYYAIDEGGVGAAVTDQVIELLPDSDIYRITLTGGKYPKWIDARTISLPKPQMASTLIALFQSRRIWVPNQKSNDLLDEFQEELYNYQLKMSESGYDQFGAMVMGQHDDEVTALGLACWLAEDLGGGARPIMW